MHQGFIVTGLELVGTDEESVGVVFDLVGDITARETVKRRFTDLRSIIIVHS